MALVFKHHTRYAKRLYNGLKKIDDITVPKISHSDEVDGGNIASVFNAIRKLVLIAEYTMPGVSDSDSEDTGIIENVMYPIILEIMKISWRAMKVMKMLRRVLKLSRWTAKHMYPLGFHLLKRRSVNRSLVLSAENMGIDMIHAISVRCAIRHCVNHLVLRNIILCCK